MGTISDKLKYILEIKSRIKDAIAKQSVPITDATPFRKYPELIESITCDSGDSGSTTPVNGVISSNTGIIFNTGSIIESPDIIFGQEIG